VYTLDPSLLMPGEGDASMCTWEWRSDTGELRWTSGQAEVYAVPSAFIDNSDAWAALVHPEDRSRVRQSVIRALETGTGFRERFRVAGRGGTQLWILGYGKVVRDATCSKLIGLNLDITQSVETLEKSERRFTATFEQAAVGIAHVSPDGTWLNANQRCVEIVGYSKAELLQMTFADITHPDDLEADWALVHDLLRGQRSTYSMEKRYLAKNGTIVWVNLTVSMVRNTNGSPAYFIAVIEDITRRKNAEFEKHVRSEWNRAIRSARPLSMIFIDFDYLKELNSACGHVTADKALKAVAARLEASLLRPEDMVARFGGDEFLVILPETDSDGAIRVAERIGDNIRALGIAHPGSSVSAYVTVSQGIATVTPSIQSSWEGLMSHASSALLKAKEEGRARWSIYSGQFELSTV
jgi:diguanylate cyclase (GGDEF)-like protein